jgi:hypothetical protein
LWRRLYDGAADNFPHLLIYTAILAVAAAGRLLWERYDSGDNLLFKERDLQEPATSGLFRELWRFPDPTVSALGGRLLLAAQGKAEAVPSLEDLLAATETGLGSTPEEVPAFTLTADQRGLIGATLGRNASGPAVTPVHGSRLGSDTKKTFGILVEGEDEPAPAAARAAPETEADDNFDLFVDSDPEFVIPTVVPEPALAAGPPPLPALPPLPVVQPRVLDDPNAITYRLEAWMPEQVAVMKVQGFVDSATGKVVTSIPGLMRVQLLDPYDLIKPAKPGLLGWLGLAEDQPPPRVLAVVDFQMQHKETPHKKLLEVTLVIRPGDEPPPPRSPRWRAYCDKLYCDIRAFLMGLT